MIASLYPSQYRQVAEWEWGPQDEDTDWARYADEMNAPQWAHFALYKGAEFVGCVSLERIDSQTVAYHVVTARRKVHSHALAQVLLMVAGWLFVLGNEKLVVRIPRKKRAAAILALRCGMLEDPYTETERHFTLSKTRYKKWAAQNPSR